MLRLQRHLNARNAIGFVIGLMTFLALHRIEVVMWAQWFGGEHSPWFMNSGAAGVFTIQWLFVVSLIAGLLGIHGGAIAAGASVMMALVLTFQPDGPGNIFPIVIVMGSLVLTMICLAGWGCAWAGLEISRWLLHKVAR